MSKQIFFLILMVISLPFAWVIIFSSEDPYRWVAYIPFIIFMILANYQSYRSIKKSKENLKKFEEDMIEGDKLERSSEEILYEGELQKNEKTFERLFDRSKK